ncbi:MARVEL domain-containing protein 1 isoform X1 [Alligator mississippiensis]|uniref:MARVEL domain-containing protein 1 isoform X1 n=1 Tax=Alligator mississippiensis TaxID=8496 RepID=UPI0028780130|nr:MARVEL domain-containing protein 1 isoform X1 [Alligator mississippiensis]
MDGQPPTQDKRISPRPLPTPQGQTDAPAEHSAPAGPQPPCPTQHLRAAAGGTDRRALAGPSRSIQLVLKVEAARALPGTAQRWVLAPGLGGLFCPAGPLCLAQAGAGLAPGSACPPPSTTLILPPPGPLVPPARIVGATEKPQAQDPLPPPAAPQCPDIGVCSHPPQPSRPGAATLPALGQFRPCLLPEGSPQCQNAAASGVGLEPAAVPRGWGARDVARARGEDGRLHLKSSLTQGQAPWQGPPPKPVLADSLGGAGMGPMPGRAVLGPAASPCAEGSWLCCTLRAGAGSCGAKAGGRLAVAALGSMCAGITLPVQEPLLGTPCSAAPRWQQGPHCTRLARRHGVACPRPAESCREMAQPGLTRAGRRSSWEAPVLPSAHDGLQPARPLHCWDLAWRLQGGGAGGTGASTEHMRPEGPEEPPALLLRPTPRLLRCHRPPQGPGARSLAVPLAGAGAPTPSTSCRLLPSPLCSSSLNKAALSVGLSRSAGLSWGGSCLMSHCAKCTDPNNGLEFGLGL